MYISNITFWKEKPFSLQQVPIIYLETGRFAELRVDDKRVIAVAWFPHGPGRVRAVHNAEQAGDLGKYGRYLSSLETVLHFFTHN